VKLPRNRYDRVAKLLLSGNENVLAFGSNFSLEADAHFACNQNDEGQHMSHVFKKNRDADDVQVTGACFIVFSGALKSTTGLSAKVSVVEDGVLVQIPGSSMEALKLSLKDMKNYEVRAGKVDSSDIAEEETVTFEWTDNDTYFNIGVRSPIDGMSLEGVNSIRLFQGTDYASNKYLIRWTELFLIENQDIPTTNRSARTNDVDPTKLAAIVSQALCLALSPYLEHLVDSNFHKIGLRVTLDPDKVGYEVGSQGQNLPSNYVNELDGALIPVIMGSQVMSAVDGLLVMELLFHVLLK
jgi:MAD (mothers against decapentaplegic) interacting protein